MEIAVYCVENYVEWRVGGKGNLMVVWCEVRLRWREVGLNCSECVAK
jgi:hypothetical protein